MDDQWRRGAIRTQGELDVADLRGEVAYRASGGEGGLDLDAAYHPMPGILAASANDWSRQVRPRGTEPGGSEAADSLPGGGDA